MDMQPNDFDRLLFFEHARKTAEDTYRTDPNDAENLTRWGGALLELSQFQGVSESKNTINDAIAKLEEALLINPTKHEALWCLGNAYTSMGFLTPESDKAKLVFNKASDFFQLALDEEPSNELYMKSLEMTDKAPELHMEIHKNGLGQHAAPSGVSSVSSNAKEMIFRGTDTVALLLEWIMARMILHPDIQAKAQQELDAYIGPHRHVQDTDIPNLPYLQAIVKEVLRMHPPGPLLSWARLAIHDVHIDKFLIPAGTTAMVNMWAITHDESIWKDPWMFRPERFIEEEVSIMGSDLRIAPFGSGRRACPGKAMGLATVQLWLARFLHQFSWSPVQQVDLSECLRLSLEMKKPLKCRVVHRSSTVVV